MKIVFLSHTHPYDHYVVGSHHLSREMSRLGHDVLHLSSPYPWTHRLLRRDAARRDAQRRSPIIREGVTDIIPRSMLPLAVAGFRGLTRSLADAGFASPDLILLDQPTLWRKELRDTPALLVYRPTDIYVNGRAARVQPGIVENVDAVIATSGSVLTSLNCLPETPSVVISNGVEYDRFAAVNQSWESRWGVRYIGALDDRFDWDALVSMAKGAPDQRFEIAGPLPSSVPSVPSNVHLLGPIDYADVPVFLGSGRIGLLPLSSAASNAGRSPMKLFEYLAAGLHVVATWTDALVAMSPPGVAFYRDSDEASEILRTSVAAAELQNVAGQRTAQGQDWNSKAQELMGFTNDVLSTVRPERRR